MSTQYPAYVLVIALSICGVAAILVVAIARRLRDNPQITEHWAFVTRVQPRC